MQGVHGQTLLRGCLLLRYYCTVVVWKYQNNIPIRDNNEKLSTKTLQQRRLIGNSTFSRYQSIESAI